MIPFSRLTLFTVRWHIRACIIYCMFGMLFLHVEASLKCCDFGCARNTISYLFYYLSSYPDHFFQFLWWRRRRRRRRRKRKRKRRRRSESESESGSESEHTSVHLLFKKDIYWYWITMITNFLTRRVIPLMFCQCYYFHCWPGKQKGSINSLLGLIMSP